MFAGWFRVKPQRVAKVCFCEVPTSPESVLRIFHDRIVGEGGDHHLSLCVSNDEVLGSWAEIDDCWKASIEHRGVWRIDFREGGRGTGCPGGALASSSLAMVAGEGAH